MNENKIRVVKIEPNKHPEDTFIPSSLEGLQEAVGGFIEIVPLCNNDCHILCNEEGKIIGLEPNRFFGEDVIVGNMCIIKIDEEGDIISLSDEDVKKYMTLFYEPIPEGLLNSTFKSTNYTDAFFINESTDSVEWLYFNPDGNEGLGQYVTNRFTFHDIRVAAKDFTDVDLFFDHLASVSEQTLADSGTREYMDDYVYFRSAIGLTDCTKATMLALIDEAKRSIT